MNNLYFFAQVCVFVFSIICIYFAYLTDDLERRIILLALALLLLRSKP